MYYKYEMHSHTSGCSACGHVTAEEMIDNAISKGMSGIVFTNHFYHGNTCIDRSLPWSEFVKAYDDDFIRAKEYAKDKDFDVIFGIEEAYRPGKEILIYGIDASVIAAAPEFKHMKIAQMRDFIRANGGLIFAAHPFRRRDYIPDPDNFDGEEFFDGVEIYNHTNEDDDNKRAFDRFEKSDILKISGTDIHGGDNFGFAGIALTERVHDTHQLADKLRKGDYHLIINGEIV